MPETPITAAAAPELEQELALARSGRMPITDLLEHAQRLGQRGLAEASARLYENWIAHTESPLRHVACFNWGTVLGALQRHTDAEAAYRRALVFSPAFVQARLNLGHQLENLGRADEAVAEWQTVVQQTEGPAGAAGGEHIELRLHALNNLARLAEQQRRYDESEAFMRRSLQLRAAQWDVLQHYVHIRQKQCEWPLYELVGEVTLNQLLVGTSPLAMLSVSDDPALQLLAAQRFVHQRVPKPPPVALHTTAPAVAAPLPVSARLAAAAGGPAAPRIRIGYLSGDLCLHAVGLLTAELFELHDRSRFEVFAFCWSREDGTPLRARLKSAFDHHVPIGGLDDAAAAQLIASHRIDVLVDLQGLTSGARPAILGMRPAPVQVGYLGLPGTSALPGVDWMIADRFVMPPELEPFCTETPIQLPHCFQVSDRQRDVGPTPTRQSCGLPDDAFVYCSFNNNFKFTEEVFQSWMRVLRQVDGSVLWLLADNRWTRENMLRAADAHGVDRERLVFGSRVGPADYLARFAVADLMLDTFPYNAGTTASDALWMGLPIVTRSGRSYISRMAGSLLNAVGLPELVTESAGHYERLAVQLGRNPKRIASYKRYLAEHGRQSPLFDVPAIVRAIESEFERLVRRARGTPPRR